MFIVF